MTPKFDRLSAGSRILVTGGTGFIGSAVVTVLLDRGYKVRIATRSVSNQQAFKAALEQKHGADAAEFIEVGDYGNEDAWKSLLQDVQGVQHLASDVSFGSDYDTIINGTKAMTTAFLSAVAKNPNVKSVVLTSSRIAAWQPQYGQDVNATKDSWADYFTDLAQATGNDDPMKPMLVYAASKVVEERTAWELLKSAKADFAFNTVLPDYAAGPRSNPSPGAYSTHGWLNDLFKGDANGPAMSVFRPASRLVDVRDIAAIHVAAMLDETSDRRRLFAASHKFEVNDLLSIWREAFPDREILPDFSLGKQPNIEVDDAESTTLLRAFADRDWYTVHETVMANVQGVL